MTQATVAKESYDLCEQENDNLRKLLGWAGAHLPKEKRLELSVMLERTLDAGGVVKDAGDERLEENTEIKKCCVQAAELMREVVSMPASVEILDKTNWYGRAEALASKLMEYDPPSEESLAAVRALSNEVGRVLTPGKKK